MPMTLTMKVLIKQLLRPVFSRSLERCFLKYPYTSPWQILQRGVSASNYPLNMIKEPWHRRNLQAHLLRATPAWRSIFSGLPKSLTIPRRNETPKKPKKRVPKLILVQNPLTWLMIKIDFTVLKSIWDPAFVENEFKFGTKQAIAKITQLISVGDYPELNGLLTKAARLSLLRDLDKNWSERQRTLLHLDRDDIQISSPRKVYFIRIADKKYCDVDMAFLALKWVPINHIEALIFTEIFARFHREYTPHSIPEWTIAYFKVTRFQILRK